jgi:hypothetical protein
MLLVYLQKVAFQPNNPNISLNESSKTTHFTYTPMYTNAATPNHHPNDGIVSQGMEAPNMLVPLYEYVCNM